MKLFPIMLFAILAIAVFPCDISAMPTFNGKHLGFYPITNEISCYTNIDDTRRNRGQTLQIVSLNTFEFTADLNWDMSCLRRDHYMELSLVKSVFHRRPLIIRELFQAPKRS
ncbi:MAG: hypothetical protein NTV06_01310 [candidate division Zixibacteria bacterium]|nr:hypothetical protein [candidate division Zixibacteria bacterium]